VEDAPPLDGRGMSVLVVEDNIEVGKFATDALTELGYGTPWSTTPRTRLKSWRRRRIATTSCSPTW